RVRRAPAAQGLSAARARSEAVARPRRRRADARRRGRPRPIDWRRRHARGGGIVTTGTELPPPQLPGHGELPEVHVDPSMLRQLAESQVNVELDTGDMILNLGPQDRKITRLNSS